MDILLFVLVIALVGYAVYRLVRTRNWVLPVNPLPEAWKAILLQKVTFYRSLTAEEKKHFHYKVKEFLLNCKVTGIGVEVDDTDRVLVAASAIIPVFNYPDWKYHDLTEVLIYPSMFNVDFQTSTNESRIMGMVGSGAMEGKMILSRKALHHGFANDTDKKNTAIHEFVHLIDKSDGVIDGIPMELLNKQYVVPWSDLIEKKINDIYEESSDINPYGGTNKAEFFAVAAEYFFGRPKLLAKKHPILYNMMSQIFGQDLEKRFMIRKKSNKIGRNDPCPCGSGKKFKKCCG